MAICNAYAADRVHGTARHPQITPFQRHLRTTKLGPGRTSAGLHSRSPTWNDRTTIHQPSIKGHTAVYIYRSTVIGSPTPCSLQPSASAVAPGSSCAQAHAPATQGSRLIRITPQLSHISKLQFHAHSSANSGLVVYGSSSFGTGNSPGTCG
jgi:hypothetical protein